MPDEGKQVENLLSNLMNRISGSGEDKSSSFPVTLVLVGLVVLIVSVMGIKLALAKRQAAKLAVQVRRAEEEKARVQENAKLSENSTERQAAQKEVKALTQEILNLKARIAKRHAEHIEYVDGLKGLTSWDDIIVVDKRHES